MQVGDIVYIKDISIAVTEPGKGSIHQFNPPIPCEVIRIYSKTFDIRPLVPLTIQQLGYHPQLPDERKDKLRHIASTFNGNHYSFSSDNLATPLDFIKAKICKTAK